MWLERRMSVAIVTKTWITDRKCSDGWIHQHINKLLHTFQQLFAVLCQTERYLAEYMPRLSKCVSTLSSLAFHYVRHITIVIIYSFTAHVQIKFSCDRLSSIYKWLKFMKIYKNDMLGSTLNKDIKLAKQRLLVHVHISLFPFVCNSTKFAAKCQSRAGGWWIVTKAGHNSPLSNEHCSGSTAWLLHFKLVRRVLPSGAEVPHRQERLYTELIKHGKSRKEKASETDPRRLPAFIWEKHSAGKELAFNLTLHIHFFSSFWDTI